MLQIGGNWCKSGPEVPEVQARHFRYESEASKAPIRFEQRLFIAEISKFQIWRRRRKRDESEEIQLAL